MKYLFLLCILSTLKVSLQSRFGKTSIKNAADSVYFNCVLFFFTALVFIKDAFIASHYTILFGVLLGLIEISYQYFYINSLSCGSVSLTVLVINLFNVIPILISALFYNEALSAYRITGIVLTFISFVICTDFSFKEENSKKWFLCTLGVASASASANVLQKIFASSQYALENKAFLSWGYVFAFLFSAFLYTAQSKLKEKKSFKTSPRVFIYALGCGLLLAVYMFVNTKALSFIPGSFFFPAYSGLSTIFTTAVGILFFKDKISTKQFIGTLVGIISLVLVNL